MTTATRTKRQSRSTTPPVPMEERIAGQLIAAMESGKLAWRRPWTMTGRRQKNVITGHEYTGSNAILTEMIAACNGWPSLWLTFNGARANGLAVAKGSKATYILKPLPVAIESENESGDPEMIYFTRFSATAIFNVAQLQPCEKLDELIQKENEATGLKAKAEPERLANAEKVLMEWPVQPSFGGDRAFYVPSEDKIALPMREQFHDAASLYGTWSHEVIHSTGHKKRLNRDLSGMFGTPAYAKEELIAELGSVLLCNRMEIGYEIENHASYLQNWIGILKEEPKFVMKALRQARLAANLVMPLDEEV